MKKLNLYYHVVATPFGHVGVVWSRQKRQSILKRVFLPQGRRRLLRAMKGSYREMQQYCDKDISSLCKKICDYLTGKKVTFEIDKLDISSLKSFQRAVLMTERKTPYGRVTTYCRLARAIGRHKAARAVGTALAHNPFPIIIPCHRTIRANGTIGGFQGGSAMKRRFLELEGVTFTLPGKVTPACIVTL
jgi:methylated-DNA-[protein]-cysteine S-methyltransferase